MPVTHHDDLSAARSLVLAVALAAVFWAMIFLFIWFW